MPEVDTSRQAREVRDEVRRGASSHAPPSGSILRSHVMRGVGRADATLCERDGEHGCAGEEKESQDEPCHSAGSGNGHVCCSVSEDGGKNPGSSGSPQSLDGHVVGALQSEHFWVPCARLSPDYCTL